MGGAGVRLEIGFGDVGAPAAARAVKPNVSLVIYLEDVVGFTREVRWAQ
jgi:hypothetical protein